MIFPIRFSARTRREGYRAAFFERITVPKDILRKFCLKLDEEKIRKIFMGYGQFRIDYPIMKKRKIPDSLRVVEKIIFRGRVTRLSGKLEEKIREITGYQASERKWEEEIVWLRDAYDGGYNSEAKAQWFDGKGREEFSGKSAEEFLYSEILVPEVVQFGAKNIKDIVPQVLFSSLTGEESDTRRVDFLVTHNGKKLAIEVDDATHKKEEERDFGRDKTLKDAGIEVFRVRDKELGTRKIENLREKIREMYSKYETSEREGREFLLGVKLAGVVQAVLVELAVDGFDFSKKNKVRFSSEMYFGIGEENAKKIISAAIQDLLELDKHVAEIYQEEENFSGILEGEGGILITENWQESSEKQILYQEVSYTEPFFNVSYQVGSFPRIEGAKEEDFRFLLNYIFQYEDFRENQADGIFRGVRGEDAIILLPTGSGKSIIYQLLAMIVTGTVIVVEPLRSLIEDQVENLRWQGIDAVVGFLGNIGRKKKDGIEKVVRAGGFLIIYVTPERMQMEDFRQLVHDAKENGGGFPVCALDEAHCVSEWGHDFRVSYLNLAGAARKMFRRGNKTPVILALTGTASNSVLKDIERDLKIKEEGIIRPKSFDRPEIKYRVLEANSGEKMAKLTEVLEEKVPEEFSEENFLEMVKNKGEETKAGVVFCVYKTWKTDFGVEAVYRKMKNRGVREVVKYYGSDERRGEMEENARKFKANEASLMIATKAFGMGIDKPNIRYTVHYGIPNSIEAYYQEAGRAGRDGEKAMSYVILSDDAPERNSELINEVAVEDLAKELKKGGKKNRDDINRLLFLHQRNYDRKETLEALEGILRQLGGLERGEKRVAAENREEFQKWQKTLFRMKVLGIIEDYTIFDYINNEFKVSLEEFSAEKVVRAYGRYVAQYQEGQAKTEMVKLKTGRYEGKRDFIVAAMNILLDFTENVFEKSRRRAIFNMAQLANEVAKIEDFQEQDRVMRRKILNHLGNTQEDVIRKILEDKTVIEEAVRAAIGVMKRDEAKLLAEVRRSLQAYPEHPGLLILAGILGSIDEETTSEAAAEDIRAAISNAEKYKVRPEKMAEQIILGMGETCRRGENREKYRDFVWRVTRGRDEKFFEGLITVLPKEETVEIAAEVLAKYNLVMISEIRSKIKVDLWTKKN